MAKIIEEYYKCDLCGERMTGRNIVKLGHGDEEDEKLFYPIVEADLCCQCYDRVKTLITTKIQPKSKVELRGGKKRAYLTAEDKQDIADAIGERMPLKEIMIKFGVSSSTVNRIKRALENGTIERS